MATLIERAGAGATNIKANVGDQYHFGNPYHGSVLAIVASKEAAELSLKATVCRAFFSFYFIFLFHFFFHAPHQFFDGSRHNLSSHRHTNVVFVAKIATPAEL